MRAILVLLIIAATTYGEQVSYEGYKLYAVTPATQDQLQILVDWEQNGRFDIWTHPHKGGIVDILVAPDHQPFFELTLRLAQMKFEVKIKNLETIIEEERKIQESVPTYRDGRLIFVKYFRLAEINNYLNEIAGKYPDVVTVETFGKSTQGRDLKAVRISTGGDGKRPAILVDAGIHAREWIAPAMGLYIIQQLVENPEYKRLSEQVDWIIVPLVNPDGYEYSHTNARMWRKTRSIDEKTGCHGVDGNRNWDHHWAEAGSSNNPCSDTYHGVTPFSEPETKYLAEYAKKDAARIKFYLSFHSFGKYILYPWGYTRKLPEDDAKLREVGEIGHSAIRGSTGTKYTVGNTVEVLYEAAGGSHDYMKGELGIKLSYTLELPGGGLTGFDLPAGQIKGVITETFEAVFAWHEYVLEHLNEL